MEKRRRRFALPAQSKMRLLRRNVRFRVRHGSPQRPIGGLAVADRSGITKVIIGEPDCFTRAGGH